MKISFCVAHPHLQYPQAQNEDQIYKGESDFPSQVELTAC